MMTADVLIVGSGCAGLYCALNLPEDKDVLVITKSEAESNDSYLAQGGICMLRDEKDFNSFFVDTMRAGHYENDGQSVNIMIRSSQDVVEDLLRYGADFQKDENQHLLFTREGAHSEKRIIYHEDTTGEEITSTLLREVRRHPNIRLMEHTTMIDLIARGNVCYGAVVQLEDGSLEKVEADYVVMATGGIGGLYRHSTNFRHLTGDALAVAIRHGIQRKDVDYVQIHPTTFYTKDGNERSFLISESVRGEGAVLRDKNGNRFVDELKPRDVVSKAIFAQMEKDGTEHVWEDLRPIPEEELMSHFPNIVEYCRNQGYDVTKECIPVVPAQHYFMGGVKVDHESRTTMEQLYAIGETACNGVHGKNRLASNSLLESLVFAKRAAQDMVAKQESVKRDRGFVEEMDFTEYDDIDKFLQENRDLVRNEIETARKERENVR